ncbi:MAG: TAG lipase/steryl ester hydrolase/phospholipase A2/LPA acyltransferase [Dinoroseobacter sp.]
MILYRNLHATVWEGSQVVAINSNEVLRGEKRHESCCCKSKTEEESDATMQTYQSWKNQAVQDDLESGAEQWKKETESGLYDYQIIQRRYEELLEIRRGGDVQELLYYLKEGLHGNMAGMGAPKLYTRARFGTKELVEKYVNEVVLSIQALNKSNSKKISSAEKRTLLRRTSMGFGRTALMLSGAGSLGIFHMGVIKTLLDEDILPRVISGASTGAFIAAILGTHSSENRHKLVRSQEFFELIKIHEPTSGRRNIDHYDLENLLKNLVPDLTFEEAYEVSGLHINISVAPKSIQQRSRLLNATTAPNALIRESVLASCAIPGMFPAVRLAARDHKGQRQPYIPSRTWIDGSIMDELPAKRLSRLYGVNYFISSQANPAATSLSGSILSGSKLSPFCALNATFETAGRQWLQSVYPFVMEQVRDTYPVNVMARNWFSSATQEYNADINILPSSQSSKSAELYKTLTEEETKSLFTEGEHATWPQVERIRTTTAVSRCIDNILLDMGEDCLLP